MTRGSARWWWLAPAGLLLGACANTPGPAATAEAPSRDREAAWRALLARAPVAVAVAFDERGRLWSATIRDRHLYVRHSDDRGGRWSAEVRVNPQPEDILGDGESRPKLAARGGIVYLAYTRALPQPMTGDIRFTRSLDGGGSFAPPVTVNDDRSPVSHRFEALAVAADGTVHLAWLDKRDQHAAQARGADYRGAALYYTLSRDGGRTFAPNRRLADHSCECCRVALALDADGTPVIAWRQIYEPNLRDHALLRLDGAAPPRRLSEERWAVDACPHHGPALAIAPDGVYHAAWFSGAPGRSGLYYRRSPDRGRGFSAPLRFGDPGAQPARPQVLSLGERVVLAWKEFDGRSVRVRTMGSGDGGIHWSPPATLARTAGASDHPQLLTDRGRVVLGWHTAAEGLRLIEVAP